MKKKQLQIALQRGFKPKFYWENMSYTRSIEKFKARLVADGNTQKHGVDFDRVFATVVKTTTIRLVLILAAARQYHLTSIDIRHALQNFSEIWWRAK